MLGTDFSSFHCQIMKLWDLFINKFGSWYLLTGFIETTTTAKDHCATYCVKTERHFLTLSKGNIEEVAMKNEIKSSVPQSHMTIPVSSDSKCHSKGKSWKGILRRKMNFRRFQLFHDYASEILSEVITEVRLHSFVISTLIPLHLVCQHKDVCLIFGDYLCIYTHTYANCLSFGLL